MKTNTYISDRTVLIRTRNVSDKSCAENQNTHPMFIFPPPPKIVPFMRMCGKVQYSQAGHRRQRGTSALRDGYVSLKTHTQNM